MDEKEFVYEEAVEELNSIVNDLNSGNVSLDDSLKLYTRGVELVKQCEDKLKEVEQKISLINTSTMKEETFTEDKGE